MFFVDVAIHNGTARGASPTAPFVLVVGGTSVETDMRCRLATAGALAAVPEIPAGGTVTGVLCFDIPKGVRPSALTFTPGRGEPPLRVPLR